MPAVSCIPPTVPCWKHDLPPAIQFLIPELIAMTYIVWTTSSLSEKAEL